MPLCSRSERKGEEDSPACSVDMTLIQMEGLSSRGQDVLTASEDPPIGERRESPKRQMSIASGVGRSPFIEKARLLLREKGIGRYCNERYIKESP